MFLFHTIERKELKTVSKRSRFRPERGLRAPAALKVRQAGSAGTPRVGTLNHPSAEIPGYDLGFVQKTERKVNLKVLE